MIRALLSLLLLLGGATLASAQTRSPMMRVTEREGSTIALQMSKVDLQVTIHGELALIRQSMTFVNNNYQAVRGDFLFPLPPGAAISGYALDVAGRMTDGVPVDKVRARQILEDVIASSQDPGLVEWDSDNSFSTRVFPIPGHGTRTVRVEYTQALTADAKAARLLLPLAYTDALAEFRLSVTVQDAAGTPTLEGLASLVTPFRTVGTLQMADVKLLTGSVVGQVQIVVPRATTDSATSVEQARDGSYYFSVRVPEPTTKRGRSDRPDLPKRVRLYWDASGSTATRPRLEELEALGEFFARFRKVDVDVELVPFRMTADPVQSFAVKRGDATALFRALSQVGSDGATNLAAVTPATVSPDLYLVVTDGRHTLGPDPTWKGFDAPIFTLSTGGNLPLLRPLTRATGGDALDLRTLKATAAVDAILAPTVHLLDVQTHGGGVTDLIVEPQPDSAGRSVVHGRLTGVDASITLVYGAGRQIAGTQDVTLRRQDAVQADMERRHWASLRLRELLGDREQQSVAIAALGREHGLVTPFTSLLVLETLDQYLTYDVPPPVTLQAMRTEYDRQAYWKARNLRQQNLAQVQELAGWNTSLGLPPGSRPAESTQDGLYLYIANVPPGVFFSGTTRSDASSSFGDDGDDDDDDDDLSISDNVVRSELSAPGTPTTNTPASATPYDDGTGTVVMGAATRAWEPNAPWLAQLRAAANPDDAYLRYLLERQRQANNPAFIRDSAAWFTAQNRPELALRILGNLAEMPDVDLGSLVVLARDLQQTGDLPTALALLRNLHQANPKNRLVCREYALALAAASRYQEAVEVLLASLATTAVETDKAAPINTARVLYLDLLSLRQQAARAGVTVQGLPPSWEQPVPGGLRVVLTSLDPNADIDLWVTEPDTHTVYARRPFSSTGGMLIVDGGNSGDDAPGQPFDAYLNLHPPVGKYRLSAYFAGYSISLVPNPVSVLVDVYTASGTADERHVQAVIRLEDVNDVSTILNLTF